jgi:MAF protein
MSHIKIWLASNSPRRREMIAWPGWPFQVAPSNIDESVKSGEKPLDYVRRLAYEKSMVAIPQARPGELIIAADTIVVRDTDILGKPSDAQSAFVMLKSLKNRSHQVITAIALRLATRSDSWQEVCVSDVRMRNYSDQEIEAYIQSGDPFDKAGGYAIQNPRFNPVEHFCGCYASVMGLPLCHLERTLRKIPGYNPSDMSGICRKKLKYDCPITRRVLAGEDIG